MIVVLDACVLYPPSLRDLLLTLAALDAFDIKWSEGILDEVSRNVLADNPGIDPARFVGHTLVRMRDAFPEAMTLADDKTVELADNDPKDRHVAAVALATGADAIVTLNVKDFGGQALRRAEVAIVTPGALVARVLDDSPELAVLAIRHLAGRWQNPPRSAVEITRDLGRRPSMAAPMRKLRGLVE